MSTMDVFAGGLILGLIIFSGCMVYHVETATKKLRRSTHEMTTMQDETARLWRMRQMAQDDLRGKHVAHEHVIVSHERH
jgi:hypothetical protein